MDTVMIVALGIIFLGAMIAMFLALRGYGKAKGIEHYEKIRDELTVREEEPEEEPEEKSGRGFSLGNLIGGFVTIAIGVSLLPVISDEVNNVAANTTTTLTPMMGVALTWVPAFFALGVIAVAITMTASALRGSGLL